MSGNGSNRRIFCKQETALDLRKKNGLKSLILIQNKNVLSSGEDSKI